MTMQKWLFKTILTDCDMFFRLTLPGRIVEDGRERAKFDIDDGRLNN